MAQRTVGRPRRPIIHGTDAGSAAHRRRGEQPCDECRRAHNAAQFRRRPPRPRKVQFERRCPLCRQVFLPVNGHQVFCSEACCRREAHSSGRQAGYTRRYLAKDGNRRRWSITCQMCGAAARVTQSDVKFCSHDCSVLWRLEYPMLDMSRWKGRRISTSTALVHLGPLAEFPHHREVIEGRCPYCRVAFMAPRWQGRVYCSKRCADLFKKWWRPRQHDDGRTWKFLVAGPCSWCGEHFTAGTADGAALPQFCSKRCGHASTKVRRGRFLVPPAVRQRIYERDGFVCQLCRVPVDMTLGSSDVWGATLDHVIPQSHQLIPDHSPKNLRLAHRYCNSIRGDLSFIDDSFFEEAS